MDVAQCYSSLKKYQLMLEHAEKALSFPGLMVKQRIAILSNYLKMIRDYYDISKDKTLLTGMLAKTDELYDSYGSEFATDSQIRKLYNMIAVPYRIIAACGMNQLQMAEEEYLKLPENHTYRETLDELMARTRERLAPKVEIVEEPVEEPAIQEQLPEEESVMYMPRCSWSTSSYPVPIKP